jgi:hypothetical protein
VKPGLTHGSSACGSGSTVPSIIIINKKKEENNSGRSGAYT